MFYFNLFLTDRLSLFSSIARILFYSVKNHTSFTKFLIISVVLSFHRNFLSLSLFFSHKCTHFLFMIRWNLKKIFLGERENQEPNVIFSTVEIAFLYTIKFPLYFQICILYLVYLYVMQSTPILMVPHGVATIMPWRVMWKLIH